MSHDTMPHPQPAADDSQRRPVRSLATLPTRPDGSADQPTPAEHDQVRGGAAASLSLNFSRVD